MIIFFIVYCLLFIVCSRRLSHQFKVAYWTRVLVRKIVICSVDIIASMGKIIGILTTLGVDDKSSQKEKAQFKVLISFTLLSIFFSPFFAVGLFIKGYWQSAIVFCVILIWLIFALWLQSKKKHLSFKITLLACIGTAIPAISLSLGLGCGFGVYYCVVAVVAFNIFDVKEKMKIWLLFMFLVMMFVFNQLLVFVPSYPWIDLSAVEIRVIFILNLSLCLFFISVLLYSIVKAETVFLNELEKMIAEKNVLLAEVHHRVKNNLAVISSMLRLQIKESNNVELNDVLQNNSNRIHSMSLTHNKLYVQNDISKIAFDKYLKDLAEQLVHSYDDIVNVTLKYDLSNVSIGLNDASTIGLIVNEIITNSIKHAFTKDVPAIIDLGLQDDSTNYQLSIADNGKGFVLDSVEYDDSLGLMLIESLISQLDGTYKLVSDQGTKYVITFPKRVND